MWSLACLIHSLDIFEARSPHGHSVGMLVLFSLLSHEKSTSMNSLSYRSTVINPFSKMWDCDFCDQKFLIVNRNGEYLWPICKFLLYFAIFANCVYWKETLLLSSSCFGLMSHTKWLYITNVFIFSKPFQIDYLFKRFWPWFFQLEPLFQMFLPYRSWAASWLLLLLRPSTVASSPVKYRILCPI